MLRAVRSLRRKGVMTFSSVESGLQARKGMERDDIPNGRTRLMSAFYIDHDGRYYRYNGYRYDSLADAVAYAELMQCRQSTEMGPDPFTPGAGIAPPTAADREAMETWHISFNAGTYTFREFQYDRLADALNYARLQDQKTR